MEKNFCLYKYFNISDFIYVDNEPVARLDIFKKIITEKEIFVPSLELLNDPFEEIVNTQSDMQKANSVDGLGILSFTTNFTNILMWSHYGQSHTGIALKFEVEPNFIKDFKKVQYIRDKEEMDILERSLVKGADWSYENEFRRIFDFNKKKVKLSEIGLKVVGLIYGFKCNQNLKDQLDEFCLALELKSGSIKLNKDLSCSLDSFSTITSRYLQNYIYEKNAPSHEHEEYYNSPEYQEYLEGLPFEDPYEADWREAEKSEGYKELVEKKNKFRADIENLYKTKFS